MAALPTYRFCADTVTLVGAAFLVVTAMAFSATVAGWLGFAVSAAIVLICASAAIVDGTRGARAIHSMMVVVGLWSVIAALTFNGSALTWLVFANALGLGALALVDLIAHEVTTERVVHELDVKIGEREMREPPRQREPA
ncbi:hypothetical protein ABN028_32170 [Actinopolymorpha sp. B17G11]|uniref:hypothetical protein n=1 Tax=Actinopolymorpha sp. B17G11 TaxID=3160861 RepID=UPI0032E46127